MNELEALAETVREIVEKEPDPWPVLCGIGVAGLAIPERHGGAGAGLRELQAVAAELGLAAVPFLGSAVLATSVLLESGDEDACARLLPKLAEGAIGSVAWTGPDGGWTTEVACRADGSTVDGQAHYVLDGDIADVLLVAAREEHGIGLYEVDTADAHRVHTPGMDETRRFSEIRFTRAPATRIGTGDFSPALDRARDTACAVLAAEQAGAAAKALELTVGYAKQRHQFGRPIGSFQALKHRMADLHVLVETARSAAEAAGGSELLAHVAKAYCAEAFSTVAAEMIQLHGGIAITWEHDAHRYFKRAHSGAALFGSPDDHLAWLARHL
ncbi:acyl-CoA dehydrogenase family protein [Amycolatopsis sp. CA-230715]|uniref:acyl-CoA dehydrogenase family protein n=1 Tax=Amycolatopsis sp. CA-230715 TaxID=2745196 RepID=UPI001C02079B|nr:acyl-CoA dehydrogenase family protein [Amycolatopsis sp. CA-230715]QWF76948.1 Acyl-CoA dehydrogenase FadE27 [Amycolatopsis sp. CA-230715]